MPHQVRFLMSCHAPNAGEITMRTNYTRGIECRTTLIPGLVRWQ
jgi:hypothetical protein